MFKLFLLAISSISLAHAYKEEIQGTGTTQLKLLYVPLKNSENVRVLVKDRFRPDIIISEKHLAQNTDYLMDYSNGHLSFKYPVFPYDDALNPRFLEINYDHENACPSSSD